jgi:hypothetical protein
MRIAELAFEPKTVAGFKMVNAEIAAVVARNSLLLIDFILNSFKIQAESKGRKEIEK